MADHPEPTLDDLLWTAAVARLVLPAGRPRPGAAEPQLRRLPAPARRRHRRLGRRLAGDDRPRQPGGAVAGDRAAARRRPRRAGSRSRRACRSTPSSSSGRWLAPRVLTQALSVGRRRRPRARGRLVRGRGDARCPFAPRDALPIDTADELGEDEIARLFAARGEELHRVFAAADALRREVNGDEVSYVVTRNVNYTNVCYFRCGFCAFSKGKLAENLRGPAYVVPTDEIVRRAQRGVGPRRGRDLPPGRDPPRLRRRLLRRGLRGDQGGACPGSTCTRSRRSRCGRARRRSGEPLDTTSRGCATPGSPRCRALRPRSSTTRCARCSAPTR